MGARDSIRRLTIGLYLRGAMLILIKNNVRLFLRKELLKSTMLMLINFKANNSKSSYPVHKPSLILRHLLTKQDNIFIDWLFLGQNLKQEAINMFCKYLSTSGTLHLTSSKKSTTLDPWTARASSNPSTTFLSQ